MSLYTNNSFLSANYFYPLSAAVYQVLRFSSPQFSEFLHDIGFNLNGKKYKLFSFALRFEKMKFVNGEIQLLNPDSYLYITSPLIDTFIQDFVAGTFEKQKIEVAASGRKAVFKIRQIESLPEIEIKNEMHLKLLSPIVLSTKKIYNEKLKPYYFRYNDNLEEMNRIFNNNLKNKYELVNNKSSIGKEVRFEWDNNYIDKMALMKKRLTKKQTIKSGTSEQTEIIGNLIPFKVNGDVDLIRTGYETGFGEKNSLGFGLAELI